MEIVAARNTSSAAIKVFQLGHVLSDMEIIMVMVNNQTHEETKEFQLGHVLSDMEILPLLDDTDFKAIVSIGPRPFGHGNAKTAGA